MWASVLGWDWVVALVPVWASVSGWGWAVALVPVLVSASGRDSVMAFVALVPAAPSFPTCRCSSYCKLTQELARQRGGNGAAHLRC